MAQTTDEKTADKDIYKFDFTKDGSFKRQVSSFRFSISNEPGAQFPAEKNRYVCPHHSTNTFRGGYFEL